MLRTGPMELAEAANLERRWLKRGFRFAIESADGRRSSVWVALVHNGSYYISTRGNSLTKISLHPGECRLAITKEYLARRAGRNLPRPQDRALDTWRRAPTPTDGAALAAVLVFPTDLMKLSVPIESSHQKPVLLFEAARPGMAIEVGFFYSREPDLTLEQKFLEIGTPISSADVGNGEWVSVVVREAPFEVAEIAPSEHVRVFAPDFSAAEEHQKLTAILWAAPRDGALRVIEVSGVTVTRNQ